jgi:hypothetical protein
MVKELCCVFGHHSDTTTRQSTRRAVARPVEHDHPDAEAVVRLLVWMPRIPRAGRPLEPEKRPAVLGAVLPPGKSPPVTQRETSVAHAWSIAVRL